MGRVHLMNADALLRYHESSWPQRANSISTWGVNVELPEVDMHHRPRIRVAFGALALAAGLLGLTWGETLHADSPSPITVSVVVTDSQTGEPVNQAHLTLIFQTPKDPNNAFKRAKTIAYTSKTDAQGRCRFVNIPEGPVKLMATQERHQAFGQTFDVSKDHSTLEVKMKPPQPLL
jgi:hypothetical protein